MKIQKLKVNPVFRAFTNSKENKKKLTLILDKEERKK